MTTIVISNGHIAVDDSIYVPIDWEAFTIDGKIGIRHLYHPDIHLFKGRLLPADLTLNTVVYPTAEAFVLAFNTLTLGSLGGSTMALESIKDSVGYPEEIISTVLTPDVATGITAQTKPGYVTLYAPEANTGVIYVGTDTVCDNTRYAIEAGKSLPVELEDLARVFVKNSVAGEKVHVFGAYKS